MNQVSLLSVGLATEAVSLKILKFALTVSLYNIWDIDVLGLVDVNSRIFMSMWI